MPTDRQSPARHPPLLRLTNRTGIALTDTMLVGYARVSSPDLDSGQQLRALRDRGCERIFTDRCSCRQSKRPQLEAAFALLRPRDALVVWRFDRLAHSTPDMLALAARLRHRGCQLLSLCEAIDSGSPSGSAVFAVLAALARLEVDLRSERARESHRARKAAGKPWGRCPAFHDQDSVRAAQALLADSTISRTDVARRLGVARSTLYRWFPKGDPDAFTGRPGRSGAA